MKTTAFGCILFFLMLFANDASALDRRIWIRNHTDSYLVSLYASNVGTDDWEEDILGSDTIPPHSKASVNLNDGSGYCRFDLKAVFEGGEEIIRNRVNICEILGWDIY